MTAKIMTSVNGLASQIPKSFLKRGSVSIRIEEITAPRLMETNNAIPGFLMDWK